MGSNDAFKIPALDNGGIRGATARTSSPGWRTPSAHPYESEMLFDERFLHFHSLVQPTFQRLHVVNVEDTLPTCRSAFGIPATGYTLSST